TYRDPKRNMDVKCELKDVHRVLFILCAASGLRFGEALGIEIPHVSPDGACIHICQKAWRGQMHDFLKTRNGEREIDLHPSVAKLLRELIGERKSGLLFRTRTGQQLHQSNILRRVLHPILEELGQPKCDVHAFRRFRNTYLRNYTCTPPGVYRCWMGGWGAIDSASQFTQPPDARWSSILPNPRSPVTPVERLPFLDFPSSTRHRR